MARHRKSMSDRIDGGGDGPATVTPIARGRAAFSAEPAPAPTGEVGDPIQIPIDLIDPSPANPRSSLGDLQGLADSIREVGVLQPLLVRPNGSRFDLIYGHRRLAAARIAEQTTVPAFFNLDADEGKDRVRRLVENLHREDLTPLDEATGYRELLDLGLVPGGQRGLAQMVGKSQSHVSKRLALLKLPADVQKTVDAGGISVTDAAELAKLADDPERVKNAVQDAASWNGGLAGSVKRALKRMEDEKAQEKLAESLRAAGVTVLDEVRRYSEVDGPCQLWRVGMSTEDHEGLRCHAVELLGGGRGTAPLCLDPQAHLADQRKQQEEAEAKAKAEQEARAAAEQAAADARGTFARALVTKGSPDAGAGVLMAQLLLVSDSWIRVQPEVVADVLGLSPDTFNGKGASAALEAYVAKGTRNAQRAVYATGVALGERAVAGYGGQDRYRGDVCPKAACLYLEHLVSRGYELTAHDETVLAAAAEDEDEMGLDDQAAPDGADEEGSGS